MTEADVPEADTAVAASPEIVASTKEHSYVCPGCAAKLVFSPTQGSLECPYCKRVEKIPESLDEVIENSYEAYLEASEKRLCKLAPEALEVPCSSCGSVLAFVPPEVAGVCAFCSAPIVAQPKSADPGIAPQGLLPFKVTGKDARNEIESWIKKLWFAPNSLKQLASVQTVSGVYLPFWTYDSHTSTYYTGSRGDYYYVTESYTERDKNGNTVSKTRRVRHTRWSHAAGNVARWFDDVLIPGTTSLTVNYLSALEPWDLAAVTSYDQAYLAGFKAQRAQQDMKECFPAAQRIMSSQISTDIRRDIGGDEQRIDVQKTSYTAITFKHILLPVYVCAYRYQQKVYQVLVNARTKEVQGMRPYSWVKITIAVIVCLALVIVIAYAYQSAQH